MAALDTFIKENVKALKSPWNLIMLPGMIAGIGSADNKVKAITKSVAEWTVWTHKLFVPLQRFFIGGLVISGFKAIGAAINGIVRETGSLQAAFERIGTMQIAARGLAPFVGGLGVAKERIAALQTLSQRGPFSFPEIAGANRSLQIFTRGAYSGTEATREIGQAAIATGNSIGAVADAVGNFYETLRSGQPINSAAESLRQLGVVSGPTADALTQMSQAGASSTEVFNKLTDSLSDFRKEAATTKDDIATITAEHEKAAEALKAGFGAPFTEAEIKDTQNMTEAMRAITPAVASAGKSFATVFAGLGMMRSEFVKVAAQSKIVQGTISGGAKAFTALAYAGTAVATVMTAMAIPKLGAMTTALLGTELAAGALGTALTLALGATGVGIVLVGTTLLTGALVSLVHQHREATREAERMSRAFQKADESVRRQIGGAVTLAQQHDALAESMNNVLTAQEALNRAHQQAAGTTLPSIKAGKPPDIGAFKVAADSIKSLFTGKAPEFVIGTQQEQAARKAAETARRTFKEAQQRFVPGLESPQRERAIEQRVQRQRAEEEARFQAITEVGAPRQRLEAMRERAETLRSRAAEGAAAVEAEVPAAAKVEVKEGRRKPIELRKAVLEKELAETEAEPKGAEGVRPGGGMFQIPRSREERIHAIQRELKAATRQLEEFDYKMLKVKLKAPETTSMRQFAEAERLRRELEAGAAEEVAKKPGASPEAKQIAKKAKEEAGGVVITGAQREAALQERERYQQEGKRLQILEQENVENEKAAALLAVQTAELERQIKLNEARVETHLKIASLTGDVESVARQTYDLSQKQLDTEIESEKSKKGPDPKILKDLENQRKQTEAAIAAENKRPGGARTEEVARLTKEKEVIDAKIQAEKTKPTADPAVIKELEAKKEELRITENDRRISVDQDKSRLDAENKIAGLKGTTAEVEQEAFKARDEDFNKQLELENIKIRPDPMRQEALETQIKQNRIAHDQFQVEEAAAKSQVDSQSRVANLAGTRRDVEKKAFEERQKEIDRQIDFERKKPVRDEKRITELETQKRINDLAEKDRQKDVEVVDERQKAEAQIADLRGGDADRAAKAFQITKQELSERLATEKSREHPDEEVEKAIEIDQKRANQQELDRRRNVAVTREESDLTLESQKARREGRTQDVVAIRDQEKFERRFEQLRQTLPEQPDIEVPPEVQAAFQSHEQSMQAAGEYEKQTKKLEEVSKPGYTSEQYSKVYQSVQDAFQKMQVAQTTEKETTGTAQAKFGDLKRFTAEGGEAFQRALAETQGEITTQAVNAVGKMPVVASSLARIGGGGGVYAPGGDPAIAIQKRIKELNERATKYLEKIQADVAKQGGID